MVSYYQEFISYLAPPIVGAFLLGLFWKRSNAHGAFAGLMVGLGSAAIIMTLKFGFGVKIPLHFLMWAPIMLLLSIAVNILVSLMTPEPDQKKVKENTWTTQIWKDETIEFQGVPWYKNFRVLCVLLIIAALVEYLIFW